MLSCYILTHNSQKYLPQILNQVREFADEIVIIDSGSKDKTPEIAGEFGAKIIFRALDNFRDQRNFALDQCQYNWVLALDSDEIPDRDMVEHLKKLKQNQFYHNGYTPDGFKTMRKWFMFGREIRCCLPVSSPDGPLRLFQKSIVRYNTLIHEEASGAKSIEFIDGFLHHYSCDSVKDLVTKMNIYTSLAAEEMRNKNKKAGGWFNIWIHSFAAWGKWYFKKGGWRDGNVGVLLGTYAFFYTFLKYIKRKFDFKDLNH
ncbi:MAG: glycosyltransferase family 2 protein [Bdellovibrionales bacterium]|nr:glycosyltransferase family 2 protein [Bdellovibrionales bacterium]